MASWQVEFADGADRTEVKLIDTIGFNNDWIALEPGALLPSEGKFTNMTNRVVPAVQPTWILNKFDIDKVKVGETGPGEMLDNDGTFPSVEFTWRVLKKL